ncbi:relaxase/mobilization nuclease domain-containing protein [Desertivirga xinjiangensis]|uniref:relaxase/mobilization nuclease domain-containing protein n=1 Tax=Desertivirga xinjiangensis TaxID=539206 RepID=UPI00210C3341|nr:relaxase/mobilization nuclease domain-containing protein [Pedobacter xinjiangensis]
MIIKILSRSATFNGVRYNTNKVEKEKGELLKVANFGALQGIEKLKPQDYINYLKTYSAGNTKVKYPQLHAVLSCKGKEKSKEELLSIAEQWLREMGYGENPYLLIFHKDTANNHIHMVSTRVGRDGKKISDSFEKIRSYEILHKILGKQQDLQAKKHLQQALKYSFSTHAQFKMLLELKGYKVSKEKELYQILKYGRKQAEIQTSIIDRKILSYRVNENRLQQLKAMLYKYAEVYDRKLQQKVIQTINPHQKNPAVKYYSPFSQALEEKLSLEIIFHHKGKQPPYGYTIIDHRNQQVLKGGLVMPLAVFTNALSEAGLTEQTAPTTKANTRNSFKNTDSFTLEQDNTFLNVSDLLAIQITPDADDAIIYRQQRKKLRGGRSR